MNYVKKNKVPIAWENCLQSAAVVSTHATRNKAKQQQYIEWCIDGMGSSHPNTPANKFYKPAKHVASLAMDVAKKMINIVIGVCCLVWVGDC